MPNWRTHRIALRDTDLPNILTDNRMDFERFEPIPKWVDTDGERFRWLMENWGTAKNAVRTEVRHCPNGLAVVQFDTYWSGLSDNLYRKIFAACRYRIIIEFYCEGYDGVTAVTQGSEGDIFYSDAPKDKNTLLFSRVPSREYFNDPTEDENDYVTIREFTAIPDMTLLKKTLC